MSLDVPADAGCLHGDVAVLGETYRVHSVFQLFVGLIRGLEMAFSRISSP
jgi:hypothetical protein